MDLALILAVFQILGQGCWIIAQAFRIKELERQIKQASKNDTRDPKTGRYTSKRESSAEAYKDALRVDGSDYQRWCDEERKLALRKRHDPYIDR